MPRSVGSILASVGGHFSSNEKLIRCLMFVIAQAVQPLTEDGVNCLFFLFIHLAFSSLVSITRFAFYIVHFPLVGVLYPISTHFVFVNFYFNLALFSLFPISLDSIRHFFLIPHSFYFFYYALIVFSFVHFTLHYRFCSDSHIVFSFSISDFLIISHAFFP